ncbi:hypothetical protein SAMN00120144_0181 [Hymenobacter roseosalivarius DSM 11622]|uniref:DUF6603 domain-containing protein n=1 Tax=Hymenobacter roseosalivarius DSM 11622 TaxID=645990 RepID=A0A1W1W2S9_9BACT|nr:DUF6603 domain-containing protein [Hymenobacter roseosalivarius]SMB99414.1 hypothetical protein SAMN00120144_0181 [Hymenobacter roseosalivarius DSM 11622]
MPVPAPANGTLERIAISLARLLAPLEERMEAGEARLLLAELGLQFPPALEAAPGFINALQTSATNLRELLPLVGELVAAIGAENIGTTISKGTELFGKIKGAIGGFADLANQVRAFGPFAGVSAADLSTFANELPTRLLDYIIIRNLEGIKGAAEALDFIGALERTPRNVGSLDPARPPFTERKLRVDQLLNFLKGPGAHLNALYQWGDPGFNGVALLTKTQKMLASAGIPAVFDQGVNPPVLDLAVFEVSPKLDENPKGILIKLSDEIKVDKARPFVQDDFKVEVSFNGELKAATTLVVQPNGNLKFKPPGAALAGRTEVKLTAGLDDTPYVILGAPGGSRLTVQQLVAKTGVDFVVNGANSEGMFGLEAEVKNGKVVIDLGGADGFLSNLLGGAGRFESDFGLTVGFNTRNGLYFRGSTSLQILLPLHIQLGPVELQALILTVGLDGNRVPVGIGANIKAELGPIKAVVEEMGVNAFLKFKPNRDGNVGLLDFSLGFRPPKGVGLSLDAGGFKGGGFLGIDAERGRYVGALELTFQGFLTLKAIGIIATKNPDGSKGFSLLIIITAEFAPLQLSFGFTLNGVGGLLALNRTMQLEAMREGVRTNAIKSVLFPVDIVANINRIVSDLERFFPIQQGRFAFGPMFIIGWGTPTLISIELGLVIEVPNPIRIAILGVLKTLLPREELPLLRLQVNFLGILDFDKGLLSFDATLYDSRLLTFTLTGDMAARLNWGANPGFILSVGGFHPAFQPPADLATMRRITINLLAEDNPRLRLESYFAVTSNTVQVGSRVELYAAAWKFNVYGFLAYDALLQFSPFKFMIDFEAMLAVRLGQEELFAVHLEAHLSGPAPWHVSGSASFRVLFVKVKANFDVEWGDRPNDPLPTVEVLRELETAFKARQSWQAILPDNRSLLVSLRDLSADTADILLHPAGFLRIAQRNTPLGLDIQKYGTKRPSDGQRFTIQSVTAGTAPLSTPFSTTPFTDYFAAAQYLDMTNSEKLARPSFEKMQGGVEVRQSGLDLRTHKTAIKTVRYEQIVFDSKFRRERKLRMAGVKAGLFTHLLAGNAASRSALSQASKLDFGIPKKTATVTDDAFRIVNVDSLQAHGSTSFFATQAEAAQHLKALVGTDPALTSQLQILSSLEL